ncbi:MAG: hypothetical protein IJD46_01010 [Bacilli bacterium]|nr:hypothetical protein [Bacilli bacterium]
MGNIHLIKDFIPITSKDLGIPDKWYDLPVFEGDRCEDVGWMIQDLLTYYHTLIQKYQETDKVEYYLLIKHLFGFAKQESEE